MAWLHFLPLQGRHEKSTAEGVKRVKKDGVSFEDLAKIAQVSRNPCGKQAFSKRGAADAARDRNRFIQDRTFYPTVCFNGCGRSIFHLTTLRPTGKVRDMFDERLQARRAAQARTARRKRARAAARERICVWEGEGGSYGD